MKNIVILGGGYAGIFAAANIKIPEYLTLKINDLLKNDADFLEDNLESMNLEKRKVITKTGIEYSYDYIIIALGAIDAYYSVKGAQQYSYSFRSVGDALKLRDAITKLPSDSVI